MMGWPVFHVGLASITFIRSYLTENSVFLIFCQYKGVLLWFSCLQDIKWIWYRVDNHADKEPGNPSAASVVTFLKFKSNGGESWRKKRRNLGSGRGQRRR
jgi:hypothetical protein